MTRQLIQKFERNTAGRDFVVGDLHGEYSLFMAELEKVDFDRKIDRVFSVGDLVDRGPQNLECLELVQEPWFYSVVGNHEDMMFEYVLGQSYCGIRMWIPNGGDWWFNYENGGNAFALVEHAWKTLPLAIEIDHAIGKIGVVHAAPPPVWDLDTIGERSVQSWMTWDRELIYSHESHAETYMPKGFKRIYAGHTPLKEPLSKGRMRWVDTGACYTGKLTLEEIK